MNMGYLIYQAERTTSAAGHREVDRSGWHRIAGSS